VRGARRSWRETEKLLTLIAIRVADGLEKFVRPSTKSPMATEVLSTSAIEKVRTQREATAKGSRRLPVLGWG
jgi:hypothetical protein